MELKLLLMATVAITSTIASPEHLSKIIPGINKLFCGEPT